MALSTPDSEPRLFHGPGPGLRLLLLVTLAVVLMVLDHRNEHLVRIRSSMAALLYPLQQAVDAPVTAARWAGENLASRETLIRENAGFRRQILDQAGRLQRMAALEAENARMRALLDSTAKVGDDVLIAEIVAVDMDRQRHRVVLNRGGESGAFIGQALIDAQGVVGQVIRDRGASAEALLITDPDHAVPVEVVRTGLRTIAVGTGDLDRLSLPFMARNADVRTGDLLVSSGLGGKFPAGYPVATVSEVRGDSGEAFLAVTARPAAALDRVREVLLVTPQATPREPPQAVAPDDQAPAPPAAPAPGTPASVAPPATGTAQ
ncbi:MAG: rod shape-determining protein MreC [Gammaproteobacteria bacterium]|nr:rod shape-determining protein MreC [Gammaproteobacteria bacterium]